MPRNDGYTLAMGEYEFVRYPLRRPDARVLRYEGSMNIQDRVQAWKLSETSRDRHCSLCMAKIRAGHETWRPITTAVNSVHRICTECMAQIEDA